MKEQQPSHNFPGKIAQPEMQDMFATLQAQLETVYDPEFPVIDIWTL